MKPILILSTCLLLTGCGTRISWQERHISSTDAERAAVTSEVEKILAATPHTLAGHDQDWDDAIQAAQTVAERTHCRTTFWEYEYEPMVGVPKFTGRWKYAEEAK